MPISAGIESASPHESKLAEGAIIRKKVKGKIKDLVGDRAYDSDPLEPVSKLPIKKVKSNDRTCEIKRCKIIFRFSFPTN
ncbi:hypothetical protein [Leptospira mayottensis]|uniref:hypothetical protein n=1 Tax=Leptospira mayottensis TaxID=1137606 RepID=UPI0030F46382